MNAKYKISSPDILQSMSYIQILMKNKHTARHAILQRSHKSWQYVVI